MRHGSVHARRQRLPIVYIGGTVRGDFVSQDRTLYQALIMETPFKILHGEGADLSHLCVIGARTFVDIKDYSMPWPGKGRFGAIARRANPT